MNLQNSSSVLPKILCRKNRYSSSDHFIKLPVKYIFSVLCKKLEFHDDDGGVYQKSGL